MELKGARVALTGASGGIGAALAQALAARSARLGIIGRRKSTLASLAQTLAAAGAEVTSIVADVTTGEGRGVVEQAMNEAFGGTDILINNAGISAFTQFAGQDEAEIEAIVTTNLLAPMALTRRLLPAIQAAGRGQIVNIGSTFGSIAFAWFSAYSASKFGLRGFSEALRRELDGSGVSVCYVAPRAVKTPLNTEAVNRMAEHVKMNMDSPQWVAQKIVQAMIADGEDVYLGFPESLFARINGLLPRLVDRALRKQNREGQAFITP